MATPCAQLKLEAMQMNSPRASAHGSGRPGTREAAIVEDTLSRVRVWSAGEDGAMKGMLGQSSLDAEVATAHDNPGHHGIRSRRARRRRSGDRTRSSKSSLGPGWGKLFALTGGDVTEALGKVVVGWLSHAAQGEALPHYWTSAAPLGSAISGFSTRAIRLAQCCHRCLSHCGLSARQPGGRFRANPWPLRA